MANQCVVEVDKQNPIGQSASVGMSLLILSIALVFAMLVVPCARLYAADQIRIAAASDLNFALKEVASRFESQSGISVQLSFGSSGNFFAQIQNGAPFDVFFSADVDYPQKLQVAGLTVPGTLYPYAIGHLVLWTQKDKTYDLGRGLTLLTDPAIKKIAIANPAFAPYGRAAVSAMQSSKVYDAVKDKLVMGENISQAAQFASTGNADVGLLALSLALAPGLKESGRYVEVPQNLYSPIEQAAVVLKSSPNQAAAKKFMDFVKQPEIQELLRKYGFQPPA